MDIGCLISNNNGGRADFSKMATKVGTNKVLFSEETVDLQQKDGGGCWLPKRNTNPMDCLGIGIELISELGHGKYSTVNLVRCRKMNKRYAVKIVSKEHAPRDYIEKFLPREITILKRVEHERLVSMEGALITDKHAFLLLEYLPNGDLQELISTRGHLSEEEARRIFHQLLDAVTFLHDLDIVHRDIKCDNIYLDQEYNIKLGDFGFATAGADCELLTEFCGSYVYAAPEMLEGEPYQGKLADIWSMGVVLYAMLCGRLPFFDESFDVLLESIYNPREKLRFHTKVSRDCRHFVRAMLTVDALQRIEIHELKAMDWLNKPIDLSTADFTSPSSSMQSFTDLTRRRRGPKPTSFDVSAEHGFAEGQGIVKDGSVEATVSDVLKALALRRAFEKPTAEAGPRVDLSVGHGPHKFAPTAIGLKGPAARRISVQLSTCQLFPQSAKGDHKERHVTFSPLAGHADLAPSRKGSLLMLTTGHTKSALRRGSLAVHRGALMASGSMIHMANEDLLNSATRLNEAKVHSDLEHLQYLPGAKVASVMGAKKKKNKEAFRRNSIVTETVQTLQQPGALHPDEQRILNLFRSQCENLKHLTAD